MKRKLALGSIAAILGLSAVLIAGPAHAGSSSLGRPPCSGSIYTGSTATGDTSHNMWSSPSNNQGKWWPGTSA